MSEQRPSITAAVVASTLLLLRDDPDLSPLTAADTVEPIEAAVRSTLPVLGHLLDRVPWPVLRRAAYLVEGLVSPGFVAHYALRKHAIREHLRLAVEDGVKQVVLVGAGFDMLSSTIPASVSVLEVDHPATQLARREALRGTPARDVTFVPVDLAFDGLFAALLAVPSFDPDAETVFVAEGVLMYLQPDRVHAALADMCRGRAARRIILTTITPDPSGCLRLHSQRRIVDWCMRWLDEPFVWGERRDRLVATLGRYGFRVESIVSTIELRDRVLEAHARRRLPRATGEVLVVARKPRGASSFSGARQQAEEPGCRPRTSSSTVL